jgi:hypothetical protein
MHGLLKKLLVLNGYLDEQSGDGGVGAGGGGAADAGGAGGAEVTGSELPTDGAGAGGEGAGGNAGDAGGDAGGSGGTGTGDGTPPVKKDDPVTKRFSQITRERDEAIRRENESREQLRVALEALDRSTNGGLPTPKDAKTTPPAEEELVPPEFIDPDQYQRDMAVYTQKVAERAAKRAIETTEANRQREATEKSQNEAKQAHQTAWIQRRAKAMERLPDYEIVAENPEVTITPAMAMGITSSDHGPDVAYYLGSNPEEAARIAALSPQLQLIEMGMLIGKITAPKPPQVTKTPPPIKPQVGSGEPQVRTVDEMSMEEYAAQRNRR